MEENKWIEKELPNGDVFHLKELFFYSENNENKSIIPTIKPKIAIKITKVNEAMSSVVAYLTHNEELVGFVECKLYKDNKAELNMASFMKSILESQFGRVLPGAPAISTEEKFRRQGKGTILLIILFEYLINKGIYNINIHTIESDSAWKFYLENGATKIDDMNAIFYDIKSLLPYLYAKVSNQIDISNSKFIK